MDPMFLIWLVISTAVFFAGLFIYRKALRLQTNADFEQMISNVNELHASEILKADDELEKMTALYHDSLLKIDQLTQDSDQKISELQGRAEDYRHQLRNLGQILDQSKSDYEIVIHEKEIAANRLMKEKEELTARCGELSGKTAQLETQLQESTQAVQALKNDSVEQLSVDDEGSKKALQKSIVLVKKLKMDNDALSHSSKTLKQNLEQLESANRNLEDKEQQVQYELVKSRAQFLGLEQMCEELKKKIEQLMAVEKK